MSLSAHFKKNLGEFRLTVDLDVEDERIGLLGMSGSGKSMTLHCIAGILTPDEGRIVLNGNTLFDSAAGVNLPTQQRRIGLMFQNYALFPHLTVAQNITLGLSDRREANRRELLDRYLGLLRIEELRDRYPWQLSGGQQQRVALARMLARDPEILMLDEPFSALDSHLRDQLEPEFLTILKEYQGTVLYVSHSIREIWRFCQHTTLVHQGTLVEIGPTQAMFRHPAWVETARLTGHKNISPIQVLDSRTLEAPAWGIRLTTARDIPSGACHVSLPEQALQLLEAPVEVNCFPVRLTEKEPDPFTGSIQVAAGDAPGCSPLFLRLPLTPAQMHRFRAPDRPLYVHIAPEHILLLKEINSQGEP